MTNDRHISECHSAAAVYLGRSAGQASQRQLQRPAILCVAELIYRDDRPSIYTAILPYLVGRTTSEVDWLRFSATRERHADGRITYTDTSRILYTHTVCVRLQKYNPLHSSLRTHLFHRLFPYTLPVSHPPRTGFSLFFRIPRVQWFCIIQKVKQSHTRLRAMGMRHHCVSSF